MTHDELLADASLKAMANMGIHTSLANSIRVQLPRGTRGVGEAWVIDLFVIKTMSLQAIQDLFESHCKLRGFYTYEHKTSITYAIKFLKATNPSGYW